MIRPGLNKKESWSSEENVTLINNHVSGVKGGDNSSQEPQKIQQSPVLLKHELYT